MSNVEYQREYRKKNPGKAAEYQAKYRERDPEKVMKQKRDSYHRRRDVTLAKSRALREKVLDIYGHKCECCGEHRSEFLAFDHRNGDGAKMRKNGEHPRSGQPLYRWIERNNFPSEFRLLCHNCNLSLGFYGYCPHQVGVEE